MNARLELPAAFAAPSSLPTAVACCAARPLALEAPPLLTSLANTVAQIAAALRPAVRLALQAAAISRQ